ncbi:type ISP restriction/modification enzyme [Bradyrhizobium sp. RP6]|uniref:type ISP restriction/modification enzyme n=1 Tax=Bradyrhizobium sp. RP6 TaxID=2489596 RepID=UPI000F54A9D5|nr:type ISP restriction/modification enzyme [Bradyrhizobium sp. RP6]RQH06890.1 DNA methyltransferase [Bradyrhizobium sp. RP6]
MPTDHRTELAAIKRFDQLVRYLRDPMGWPIDGGDFEELTFEYTPEELGIDAKNAAKIQEIKRLRPLSANQPWGIFFVKFEPKSLPVVALRRILSSVALKKRASANAAERAAWAADDLLFISNYGAGEERQISFAHFSRADDGRDLPTLKVLGWDNLDTALHLDAVASELRKHLAWPKDDADVKAWRENWRSAFNLRHREVVVTSRELSIRLAELARAIRDRIGTALAIETDKGPLTKLMKAFREALVHDLDPRGFADMYAQTIAYGLLSARIADPHKKTADDFAAHMRTNPFLRELMETFLKVGGRRGKAGGPGIDFDELGVSEVVELLDDANMEAVIRDFGDRNRAEDPVMHFYELFLHEYNKQLKVQRGVFYTPQPVVSYIVRGVHELLRAEFDLADGLADTATWGEMLKRHPNLKLPLVSDEPGETRTIAPEEPFVQILDPATGTATFLVEVIDVIYRTLSLKWRQLGLSEGQQNAAWNDYVPEHLLPRLHAYELMMAPYAIAHMKISLKLAETGYLFATEERARIYLSNALEPWVKQLPLIGFGALAHEAAAVNEIKRSKRFTVVIGNPPYAGISSNMTEYAQRIVDAYKVVDGEALNERKLWLQDDYVKFIRKAQATIDGTGAGVIGYITNHGYLDNPTFRGMRQSLLTTFSRLRVLNLHGNANKKERAPDGSEDRNVFDIRQGVAICLGVRIGANAIVEYADLWGSREYKYAWLGKHDGNDNAFTSLKPDSPFYFLEPQNIDFRLEYDSGWKVTDIFPINGVGVVMARDSMTVDFDADALWKRVRDFASLAPEEARAKYGLGKDARDWRVATAQADVQASGPSKKKICPILYRPFDSRFTYYTGNSRGFYASPCRKVMSNMVGEPNVGLAVSRSVEIGQFNHVFCTAGIIGHHSVSLKEVNYLCPLWLLVADDEPKTLLKGDGERRPNLAPSFLRSLASALSLETVGAYGLPAGMAPEDIFNYIYALLHSPVYRSRYAEFLKVDFPRVPLTGSLELFRALVGLGGELSALHVLDSPKLAPSITEFIGERNPEMEKVSWSQETVWIDKAQTIGFRGVREDVWAFQIGGYQVCEKWLKDRKGRTLSKEDIEHYQKIIAALAETIRIMRRIDEVIDAHGGWPGAFVQGNAQGQTITIDGDAGNVTTLRHPNSAAPAYRTVPSRLLQAAEPDTTSYDPAASVDLDARCTEPDELDREDLICRIRHLFGDGQKREREAAIDALARELGYQRTGARIYDELDGAMRAAVRRGITASDRGVVRLFARAIEEYDRDFLKEQFLASLQGRQWTAREEAVRAFARWMGYRRTGPAIEDAARSLINGLLREGRLESAGSEIRRSD